MQSWTKIIALIIFLAFMIPVAGLSFKIQREHKASVPGNANEEESRRKVKGYFKKQGLLILGLIAAMLLFFFVLRLIESSHK